MEKLNKVLFLSLFVSTALVTSSGNTSSLNTIVNAHTYSDSTKVVKDSVIKVDDNFDFAYKAFRYYNSEIDTETVNQFIRVCEFYNFDTTKTTFKLFVGQILIESGAKHYKNGNINIGGGGHIGIAQISPKSGLAIMTKYVTNDDFKTFRYLSNDSTMVKPTTYSQSVKWLSNKNNNLIFWGYIMSRNIRLLPAENALVRYNAGPGGYQSYVNSGRKIHNHHYIIGIKSKLSKVI